MLVLKPIAKINSDFTTKFGIPRQSGLVKSQLSTIVFEPEYRDANALRGLEEYSHIWLIWGFSEVKMEHWSPMVKPPRLGGNKRMGVFATRSPYRPNPIGLSCVKLVSIDKREGLGNVLTVATPDGPVIEVTGADLMDGTPIYDIKPYLSFTDSHQDAENGFAGERLDYSLDVSFPDELLSIIPADKRDALIESLAQDPRPAYITEPGIPFGFEYAGFDVRFKVADGVLSVYEIIKL